MADTLERPEIHAQSGYFFGIVTRRSSVTCFSPSSNNSSVYVPGFRLPTGTQTKYGCSSFVRAPFDVKVSLMVLFDISTDFTCQAGGSLPLTPKYVTIQYRSDFRGRLA